MYIKKLIGTKCYLSPLNLEDAEQYAVWLNDMEVLENLTLMTSVVTVDSEREFLKTLAQAHNYGIIDIKTDQLIGNIGFKDIDHLHRTTEIGIFIGDKSYWDKGYGQEALSLLLDYAFKSSTCILFCYESMTLISGLLPATKSRLQKSAKSATVSSEIWSITTSL